MTNDVFTNVILLVARVLVFFTAIPFHEFAHAFVSDKLGDPTPRNSGRLTLNPIKHLDPWGMLALLVVGIGWAKPVPVNPAYYKNRKAGMAITAAAGPLSNFLLAYINMVLYKLFIYGYSYAAGQGAGGAALPIWAYFVAMVLYYLALTNVVLGVFNLLPIPPFDGSRIFLVFLPEKWYFKIMQYERIIMFAVILLMVFGNFSGYLSGAYSAVMNWLGWATGYIDVIFSRLLTGSVVM